jgi:hypothetical protein
MDQFRIFLSEGSLREIHLQGWLFTWSNERAIPHWKELTELLSLMSGMLSILIVICKLFLLLFGSCSTTPTDQCGVFSRKRFHFRSFWPKLPGFMQVIERVWHCPMHNANPFSKLAWLLRNTSRCLQSWSAKTIGNVRVQLSLATEVVLRLEVVRDCQPLAPHEESLRQFLKLKSLRLASLQCTIV